MSKDRVEFTLCVNGLETTRLAAVYERAFGERMPIRGKRDESSSSQREFVKVRCRPSQFARFIILRCEAGLQNSIKELEAKLLPADPAPELVDVTLNPAA